LNYKAKDELEEVQIQEKIFTIIKVKRVLKKKNLMIQLENNCKVFE